MKKIPINKTFDEAEEYESIRRALMKYVGFGNLPDAYGVRAIVTFIQKDRKARMCKKCREVIN